MKRALIDHARMRIRRWNRELPVAPEDLELYEVKQMMDTDPAQVVALEAALAELKQQEPLWAEALEHRFYVGLTDADTGRMMNVAPKTIQRWRQRALPWLAQRMLEILNEDMPGVQPYELAH